MQRIDRQRIEAARAPVIETIQTRIADVDVQGHVNNAAAVELLQEARARFNLAIGLPLMMDGLRAMVAGLQVDYVREMHHPDPIEVATSIIALGRTSFTLGQVARQQGVATLYAEATMVLGGPDGPVPLPDALRTAFAAQHAGERQT